MYAPEERQQLARMTLADEPRTLDTVGFQCLMESGLARSGLLIPLALPFRNEFVVAGKQRL